jgi:hypothetical protein
MHAMLSLYCICIQKVPSAEIPAQVRREAAVYWWLRAALAPVLLLNMAINGILQASTGALRAQDCELLHAHGSKA